MPTSPEEPCACGSGRSFVDCCEPLLQGRRTALTAEALMRSRFSAYKLRRVDYLRESWHSTTRPETLTLDAAVDWQQLEVLDCVQGGALDGTGVVEFVARCRVNGAPSQLRERSRFVREAGQWRYLDGSTQALQKSAPDTSRKPAPGTMRTATPGRPGRNGPCPCGSGKKFKRCCGR